MFITIETLSFVTNFVRCVLTTIQLIRRQEFTSLEFCLQQRNIKDNASYKIAKNAYEEYLDWTAISAAQKQTSELSYTFQAVVGRTQTLHLRPDSVILAHLQNIVEICKQSGL
jgi:hypothetical protein